MFYSDKLEERLRFGDVLDGYLSIDATIEDTFLDKQKNPFTIDVQQPYCVVLDPCCSIGEGTISLTPLIRVPYHWWDNPYLLKDMLIINRLEKPIKVMHPGQWNAQSEEALLQLVNANDQYNLLNYFVYGETSELPPYPIIRNYKFEEVLDEKTQMPKFVKKEEEIRFDASYHLINFKNAFHIKCTKIDQTPDKPPSGTISKSKFLQLSKTTRNQLREKLAYYFGHPPDEDM